MKTYNLSGKQYQASSADDLLGQVKDDNAHTRTMDLQEYMDSVAANVINSMTNHQVELPASSEEIVKAWKSLKILKEVD